MARNCFVMVITGLSTHIFLSLICPTWVRIRLGWSIRVCGELSLTDIPRRYKLVSNGTIEPLDPVYHPIASGPRRTVIHPSGQAMYTLHEISSTISVAKIDTTTPYGNVTLVQTS
jgi:hypothetical protein